MEAPRLDPIVELKNFLCESAYKGTKSDIERVQSGATEIIQKNGLLGCHSFCVELGVLREDQQLSSALRQTIEVADAHTDKLLDDKTLTDIDTAQLKLEKMRRYLATGMLPEASASLEDLHTPLVPSNTLFTCYLSFIRIAYFRHDKALYCKYILACKEMLDQASYENRSNYHIYLCVGLIAGFLDLEVEEADQYGISVYRGAAGTALERHSVMLRVASLFRAIVPTYSAELLLSYEDFIVAALLLNLVSIPRKEFLALLQTSSDALRIIADTAHLADAIECVQKCKYGALNDTLLNIHALCRRSFFLRMCSGVITREYRTLMIRQFLQSYVNASIPQLAATLRMPVDILQKEIESLIVTRRLSYRIDQLTNIMEEVNIDGYEKVCANFLLSATRLTKRLDHLRKVLCE